MLSELLGTLIPTWGHPIQSKEQAGDRTITSPEVWPQGAAAEES